MLQPFCGPRGLAVDDVLLRITGSPLVGGNNVRILRNGDENYPEWEGAISSATKTIHIEMYVIHNDAAGKRFRDLLTTKARRGVKVRVLYDWFGSISALGRGVWKSLINAGGEVRAVNPPGFTGLLGLASRDHRKVIVVDGSVAFISGLCVGDAWAGDKARGIAPWRDTGMVISGPSVADVETAFAESWQMAGPAAPAVDLSLNKKIVDSGSVSLRVVASSPDMAGLYRLDLLMASAARDYLWLADAYFIGTSPYIQALRSAAMDGVDVRLLVPHGTDIQWIANISRTMYRSLLEAGVRVFEWNGPMMHAKTAVCDDHMARIGSTNLNMASWIGNWEMDVIIEDDGLAREMKEMFKDDLKNSTEIVITGRNKVRLTHPMSRSGRHHIMSSSGKSVIAGAVRVGSAFNKVLTGRRHLERTESVSLLSMGVFLFLAAMVCIFLPRILAYPLGFFAAWAGIFFFVKGLRLRFGNNGRRKVRRKK